MCYFEDCEDRYWPREDNTPDCPYEDCDNSTDTGNTNPGGTGTTNPGSAIFVSATATTVRTESAARPGTINPAKASACMTLLIPIIMHGHRTLNHIVGIDGKAVAIREGSAYICIRSRSNPAFRRCIRVVATNTPPAPTFPCPSKFAMKTVRVFLF